MSTRSRSAARSCRCWTTGRTSTRSHGEEPLTAWAPGGGVSTIYQRPAWQTGGGVDNARSNGMRQVPDVAAAADPASGFLSVTAGDAGSTGGTSAASPFWAGPTVLVRQLAQGDGVRGLGPTGPTLYAVAAAQAPGGRVPRCDARRQPARRRAGAGWDYATGLGTPRGPAGARHRRPGQGGALRGTGGPGSASVGRSGSSARHLETPMTLCRPVPVAIIALFAIAVAALWRSRAIEQRDPDGRTERRPEGGVPSPTPAPSPTTAPFPSSSR